MPLLLRSLYSSEEDQKADTFSNQRIILGPSKVCSSFSTIQENLNEHFDQPNTIRTERRVAWKQKEGTQPDREGVRGDTLMLEQELGLRRGGRSGIPFQGVACVKA